MTDLGTSETFADKLDNVCSLDSLLIEARMCLAGLGKSRLSVRFRTTGLQTPYVVERRVRILRNSRACCVPHDVADLSDVRKTVSASIEARTCARCRCSW